jgi:hypothetical protein
MKNNYVLFLALLFTYFFTTAFVKAQNKSLRLVFIRHAERPDDGENLTCKGFNRSVLLSEVLFRKFGIANNIYVPSLSLGGKTKRARMLQTITPYAVKYNLSINSKYGEDDFRAIGNALLKEKRTVIIVWEHNSILPIMNYLGIREPVAWPDNDFDTIWIVTFKKGGPTLAKDRESLDPPGSCSF